MSGTTKRWVAVFAAIFVLLTFQNCEGLESTGLGGSDSSSANANGDGYSGLTVEYPETVESGSRFAIRVNSFEVRGLDFEILEGQATIHSIENTSRAVIIVEESYVGSLIILVTTLGGQTAAVEIQVIPPKDITDGIHNQSFGKHMVLAGKRIVSAVPRANDRESGVINQGRVLIYNHNPVTDDILFHQVLHNPDVDPQVEVKFGQALDGFGNKDLVVGAPNANKVYHFRSIETDDFVRQRYILVDSFENKNGEQFGTSVIANEWKMIIAEKGKNFTPGSGKIYVYHRDSSDDVNYQFSHEIAAPANVMRFGRSIEKIRNLLLVSGVKAATPNEPRHGIVLVYNTGTGEIIQTIDKSDVSFDYGRSMKLQKGFLFLGASFKNEQETDREFVDIFRIDENTNSFIETQRIVNPDGEQAQGMFSEGLAFDGTRLFISAPTADSPQQKGSGVIHIYRINSASGQFSRTGAITPNFSNYDYVANLGRTIVCDEEHLFISVRGIIKNSDDISFKGDIYAVPLSQ